MRGWPGGPLRHGASERSYITRLQSYGTSQHVGHVGLVRQTTTSEDVDARVFDAVAQGAVCQVAG